MHTSIYGGQNPPPMVDKIPLPAELMVDKIPLPAELMVDKIPPQSKRRELMPCNGGQEKFDLSTNVIKMRKMLICSNGNVKKTCTSQATTGV